jgi:hypothetical protein
LSLIGLLLVFEFLASLIVVNVGILECRDAPSQSFTADDKDKT